MVGRFLVPVDRLLNHRLKLTAALFLADRQQFSRSVRQSMECSLTHQAYDKRCIALAQLETAVRLFYEGHDYFSVITLAGAAEEIFGQLLKSRGKTNSLEEIKAAAVSIYKHLFGEEIGSKEFADRANRARNALKHHDPKRFPTITLDVIEEATDMLNRAIDNYWQLEESLTPAMERFSRDQRVV